MVSLDKTRRLCLDAMLLGIALLLSYLEAVLPLTVWLPLPGFKFGLANIMITLVFVTISPRDAALLSLCRISMMGLLFGNAASFSFSLCGALLSYAGLWLFAHIGRRYFGMVGISVGCAALHNIGQLFAAALWFGTEVIFGYLPMLLIAALLFGTITGILLTLILPRFTKLQEKLFLRPSNASENYEK